MTGREAVRLYQDKARRAVSDPPRLAKRALCLLSAAFPHTDFLPFIVLACPRTGSNLLLSYLDRHPRVAARGEICMRRSDRSLSCCLRPAFGPQPRCIRASGFKVFYEHPLDDHSGLLWRRLQSEPRLHVIHLTRDDLLRTVVSRKIAHQDGVWTDTQIARRRMPSPTRVSLTAEEAVEGFEKIRRWEERWPLMFAGKPILRVTYEELARRPRATMHRVFGFLGQSYVPPRTPLNRLNPRALSEMILNYQSLKMALADSTWTSFFDE